MACTEFCTTPHSPAGPAVIHEHQAVGIEIELPLEPGLAPDQDVGALLFGRMRGLFVRVQPQIERKRFRHHCRLARRADEERIGCIASPAN